MTMWAVFITANSPSRKALNRALLLIQDFEFSDPPYPEGSQWTVLTSKQLPTTQPNVTTLPISDLGGNDFASMSLTEINTFVRENEDALKGLEISSGDWLVIDQKGFETSTCLVCEQIYNFGEDEDGQPDGSQEGLTSEFRACRIPYEQAHSMVVNLDLANMDFEEWVDEDAGKQEDGAWRWRSFPSGEGETGDGTDPVEIKRAKALQDLKDGGHVE
ncbi:hypothetical protein K438DRAFT_1756705 [Mycena galopus ATCC 62051]|nr:hypothetical protein K438DRAFT_1756705 [Mycena galopus ATCC 62051]